jgi:transcription-repair coupling factor (superfamily II helicase)
MGLYRRLNELTEAQEIEAFGAELIDRFGPLPDATENLLSVIQTKLHCRQAAIAKLDVGPKGALVTFHPDGFPKIDGLLAYVERLSGTAKLRPDSKLVIQRNWPDAKQRLNGALKLSQGLAKVAN